MKLKASTYNQFQPLYWTEDNRLQAVKDDKMGVYYNYDATGERNLKLTGTTIDLTQNGTTINIPILDQQTLYASALVTVNDKGYTKHYFEEGKRICSRIGGGELQKVNDLVEPIEGEYDNQKEKQYEGIKDGNRDCIGGGWFDIEIKNLYESVVQPYESKINSGEPIFYYHSDHLGSASFLTDETGSETQQLVYLPFGEDWVDMKYNTSQYDTPYKFNGKEKDQETGYNYFGARFYFDWASIWLSVDPLSDKYPHLTSYNYCANNPVMLIDPDGRSFGWYEDENGHGKFDPKVTSQGTTPDGGIYIGKTALLMDEYGNTVYGDEKGNTHNMGTPLQGVEITAVQTAYEKAMSNPWVRLRNQHGKEFFGHDITQAVLGGLSLMIPVGPVVSKLGNVIFGNVAKRGISLWPAASGGRTVINGIEYTTHALERMQPTGTILKGSEIFSRGIPPSVVENAIKYGKVTPGKTASEVLRTFGNVRVVTNPAGTRVITVIKVTH